MDDGLKCVGVFLLVVFLIYAFSPSPKPHRPGGSSPARAPRSAAPTERVERSPSASVAFPRPQPGRGVYRPRAGKPTIRTGGGITFRDSASQAGPTAFQAISDLVDPLTGARLQQTSALYRCACGVYYQSASYEVIRAANADKCVACGQTGKIVPVAAGADRRGRNASVNAVTLESYRQFEGQVITFEGEVVTVRIARSGRDYAVMFEDAGWVRGFKMVFFRGTVQAVGGPPFLFRLVGKTVRVRGLLVKHADFGWQIIVSDRAMILGVS